LFRLREWDTFRERRCPASPSRSQIHPPESQEGVIDVAIDLGTANTLIHVRGEGLVLNEPSVVAVDRATRQIRAVGLEAKRMLGRTPEGTLAIRPLRDGVIADVDMAEAMLRQFLQAVIPRGLFRSRPRLVVGVPSGITEIESRAVRAAGVASGAKEVHLISEPMAAAIGAGLPVTTPRGNMVVNVGGGTTEIGVIALSGIVADASIRVGGNELDEAIVSYVRRNYNLLIGEATAEAIKIQIGSAFSTDEPRSMDVKGRDLVSGIPKTITVGSEEIRQAIQETLQAILEAIRRALEVTPPELAADIVDAGIVLTGGVSQLRGLNDLIGRETRLTIHLDEEPLTSVVRGAARVYDDWNLYSEVLVR